MLDRKTANCDVTALQRILTIQLLMGFSAQSMMSVGGDGQYTDSPKRGVDVPTYTVTASSKKHMKNRMNRSGYRLLVSTQDSCHDIASGSCTSLQNSDDEVKRLERDLWDTEPEKRLYGIGARLAPGVPHVLRKGMKDLGAS